MANQDKFRDYPVLSWAIDDWQQFRQAINTINPNFNLNDYVETYRRRVYDREINVLFSGASIKLNLGGESEKSRITATEKPIGVFDFSLASRGLYKVQEYFSEKLEKEYPNKFKEFELPSGVVPNDLIREKFESGNKEFYFEDSDGVFPCVLQQKGQAAVNEGVAGAKLKYATKNKKVYLTFKKNKGKVRYVEIYSLFYYNTNRASSLDGNVQFAIRHIPAIMVAEYLESMGIMTRIYMTRFVELVGTRYRMKEFYNGNTLPLYNLIGSGLKTRELFIQPIIVKDFGQDLDKPLAFMVSSSSYREVYDMMAEYSQRQEVTAENNDIQLYGFPDFNQEEYYVGIERYRNKYKQYVDLGIFKSKEILPEAMLFFHDTVIATRLRPFLENLSVRLFGNTSADESQMLVRADVNPFFSWWMKLSANVLKDKINIINSNELQKDIYLMKRDAEKVLSDFEQILRDTQDVSLRTFFTVEGRLILRGYYLSDVNGAFTFTQYLTAITNEITTYADGQYFATDDETREKRDELVREVLNIAAAL